ncbi:MAG TPA: glycosyltransferase family 39 protein [Xanthobacteraceae bacterium]|jgi:4-amino-4-deoxy-L-arabinose transferase-like glycosyltransferase|nr:glycosyltransferase family 39 protein [Xanthobacteraceae bacterium]
MAVTTHQEPRHILPAPGLRAILDMATASHARAVALLIVLSLASFLPGFFQIPPVDRDEARFAQATKQMIETGDYVDIRFQDESRYKKPVGIYWLQAAVVKTAEAVGVSEARTRIWLYRIPSLLGAVGAVLLTYWTALAFVSRRAALLAGMMLATCVLLGVEARLAKTDAMLLLTSAAAMGALGRIYLAGLEAKTEKGGGWTLPAIFWTAIAGGLLLKGPLILMFVALAAAALAIADRNARWLLRLRPLAGVLWVLLLVLPWFVAILLRSGESFLTDSVGQDLFAKVVSGQESHGAPPGSYFVMFWATFWPGSVLAGLAALPVWNARREPGARFLLAWLIPSWIVFEIVATKLPHYVLPLYPAIAILIGGVVDSQALTRRRWLELGTGFWFAVSAALALAAIVAHIAIGRQLGLLAWPFAAGAIIFGLLASWLYRIDGAEPSLARASIAAIFVSMTFYGATFPALPMLFPAVELASEMQGVDCPNPAVATAGYHEPSLVFLIGTDLRHTDGAGAADFLRQGGCRFAFVERGQERSFAQRADAIGLRYALASRVDGYNISGGRKISVAIFRAERTP